MGFVLLVATVLSELSGSKKYFQQVDKPILLGAGVRRRWSTRFLLFTLKHPLQDLGPWAVFFFF